MKVRPERTFFIFIKITVMKKFIIAALLISAFQSFAQYDKALAESLGADEYGMRSYIMAILKTGPAQIADKEKLNGLFKGHMDNIQKMAGDGKLVVAGPMKKNPNEYRGIYIFNVKTIAEAEALLANDPVIREKVMTAELYEWYGSAALPQYLPFHEKIEMKKH